MQNVLPDLKNKLIYLDGNFLILPVNVLQNASQKETVENMKYGKKILVSKLRHHFTIS